MSAGMTLGAIIKQARTLAGATQRQVADWLGVTPSAVSQWESDETRPDQRRLFALATRLQIHVDEMLEAAAASASKPAKHEDLLAALKQAAHDFADISFSAPAPYADMALKGEQAVRAAIAKARKAT